MTLSQATPDMLRDATLELLEDGWQVAGPNLRLPIPLSVALAYEMSGYGQDVLDETRHLCGILRLRRGDKTAQENLTLLRKQLADARKVKEARSAAPPT
jgi:hypothetical protein